MLYTIIEKGDIVGVYRKKLTDLENYYLIGLLHSCNYMTDLEKVQKELSKRLDTKSCLQLLLMWKEAKNQNLKNILEEKLAVKYRDFDGCYEMLPNIAKKYFQDVESLDAIATLTYAKCEEINQQALFKYAEVMEVYLDMMPSVAKNKDGDSNCYNKIVSFQAHKNDTSQKELPEQTKIYRIKDWKARRK